jgi:hypothetical protein
MKNGIIGNKLAELGKKASNSELWYIRPEQKKKKKKKKKK